jgi:K+-sensing histidine kinase KdpD
MMNTRVCSPEIWAKTGLTVERRTGVRLPGVGEVYQAKRSAEAANLAKSEFLSTLCHEIRNPVSVMVGMMDLALQTNLTQEQREYLTLMKISSGSVLSVINDTLDIEKMGAGFIKLESLSFSLRNNLADTVKMLTFEAQRKGLHLSFTVATDVPDRVRGDPMRLRQIVLNLMSNAIKFTDHGAVLLQVTRQEMTDGELTCCFAVSDTGPGIPLDRQAAIFEPFVQADAAVARERGGSGLGLSIVARLVKLMNGKLWLESQPGSGCTFFFTVCFGLPGEQSITHQAMAACGTVYPISTGEQVAKPGTRPASSLRILLVDDDPLNRRMAQLVLEKEGCCVTLAMSAESALETLQHERFDVVLMDMKMPGMDGAQATREIRLREKSNGGEHVLVFALTANVAAHDQQTCLESGMDGFLNKPIQPGSLFALIRELQATPFAKQQPSVLNERALMDSVGGEASLLVEIVDLFLVHSEKLMKRARESLATANHSQFEHIMHTLKGMFQCLFAKAGERVARDLQDSVAVDQRVEVFEQLEQEVALLKIVLIRLKRKARLHQGAVKLRPHLAGPTNQRKKFAIARSTGGYWHA